MRWQYRITFSEGNTGTCISVDRIWDCLAYAHRKFGADRVSGVEERFGDGEWVSSELLPMSQEEADAID